MGVWLGGGFRERGRNTYWPFPEEKVRQWTGPEWEARAVLRWVGKGGVVGGGMRVTEGGFLD